MATLAVGIVATQAMSFGTGQDEHSNLQEMTNLVNEIEDACEAVEEYGRLPISQEFEVELIRAEIDIDDTGDYEMTLEDDDGDSSESLKISCNTDIEIGSTSISSGTTEIRISGSDEEIAVEVL